MKLSKISMVLIMCSAASAAVASDYSCTTIGHAKPFGDRSSHNQDLGTVTVTPSESPQVVYGPDEDGVVFTLHTELRGPTLTSPLFLAIHAQKYGSNPNYNLGRAETMLGSLIGLEIEQYDLTVDCFPE